MYIGDGQSVSGGHMAAEHSDKLTRLCVTIAKNGYEIEASYEPKKTLSQKKGWVPSPWCEPDKYVCADKAALVKKINELLK
jgi:hypothetical protein